MGIAEALITLVSNLAPLAVKALTSSSEQHAQILVDAQAALAQFTLVMQDLPKTIAQDDADADADAATRLLNK